VKLAPLCRNCLKAVRLALALADRADDFAGSLARHIDAVGRRGADGVPALATVTCPDNHRKRFAARWLYSHVVARELRIRMIVPIRARLQLRHAVVVEALSSCHANPRLVSRDNSRPQKPG